MGKWFIRNKLKSLGLLRVNYRGIDIPVLGGLFYLFFILLYFSFYLIVSYNILISHLIFLVGLIGAVSLIDDMVGNKNNQGFRGHFKQLFQGNITTGSFKAIVSALAVIMIVASYRLDWVGMIDIGFILLLTNFFNLLDLRPGRSIKFFLMLSLFILFFYYPYLVYLWPIILISAFYLPFELHSKVMLGDSGANTIGVIAAYVLARALPISPKVFFLIIIIVLTLISEKYSFSQFIESNSLLNWFDQLGR